MNIDGAWAAYKDHTTRLSDTLRKSAIGILVIIWTFTAAESAPTELPWRFVLAGALVAIGLLFDIAQYATLALLWQLFARHKERQLSELFPNDVDQQKTFSFLAWERINTPGAVFFWLKCIVIVASGLVLAWELGATFVKQLVEKVL